MTPCHGPALRNNILNDVCPFPRRRAYARAAPLLLPCTHLEHLLPVGAEDSERYATFLDRRGCFSNRGSIP
jgi:hypothetical protein